MGSGGVGRARRALLVGVTAVSAPGSRATRPVLPGPPGAAPASQDWPAWTHDPAGSRYAAGETRLTPATVGNLRLKWAFAYPKVQGELAKSQPAVVGGVAYFGS